MSAAAAEPNVEVMTRTETSAPSTAPGLHPERSPAPRLPVWARVLLTILALVVTPSGVALPYYALLMAAGIPLDEPGAVDPGLELLLFAGQCVLTLGVYLLLSWALMRGLDRRPFRALGLALNQRAAVGLAAGTGISLAALLLSQGLSAVAGWGREMELPAFAAEPVWVIVLYMVLLAFVLQGIGEEVLFRGYLLRSLSRRPHLAVMVSAAAFMLPHLRSSGGQQSALEHVVYLTIPFAFGLSAGYLALAVGSVWAAIGIHAGFHVATAVGVAMGLSLEGPAPWLTVAVLHGLAALVIARRIPASRYAQISAEGPYGV